MNFGGGTYIQSITLADLLVPLSCTRYFIPRTLNTEYTQYTCVYSGLPIIILPLACSTFKAYYCQLTVINCLFIKFLYLSTVKLDIISLTVTECPKSNLWLNSFLLFYLFLLRLLIICTTSFIHIAWHCLVLTIWQVACHFKECFVPQLFLY